MDSSTNSTPFNADLCDFVLVVGPEGTRIPVIRKVLQMHSPVFNRMLTPHGPYREAGQDEIILRDQEPDIFNVLLHIMALRVSNVSPSPFDNPRDLLYLADLADKYDCVEIIRPCFSNWVDQAKIANRWDLRAEECCQVYWIMGMECAFMRVWTELVDGAWLPSEAHGLWLRTSNRCESSRAFGRPMHVDLLPDAILPAIREAAQSRLTDLHQAIQQFVLECLQER